MIGLAQRLPTWATVTQCLGNRCPIPGQRSPNGRVERCDASHSVPPHSSQSRIIAGLCLLRVRSTQCRLIVRNPASSRDCVPPASSQFRVIAGLRRRPLRPPRSRTQRHWEAVSQSLGDSFPALGNRSLRSGGPCLSAPKPFPNAWDTVSQYLGNGFPILGKRIPNTWETIAQNLGSGCPMLGKEGARYVGNGCRVFGQIVLDISTTAAQ